MTLPPKVPFYALPDDKESALRQFVRSAGRSKRKPLIKVGQIPLYQSDLALLMSSGWLNDEIINAYFTLLTDQANGKNRRVFAFSTFFYTKLCSDGYSGVQRWTRKVPIWELDRLIVPLNFGNTHWAMAVIDIKQRMILFLDSMGSYRSKKVFSRLLQYLYKEFKDKPPSPDKIRHKWLEPLIAKGDDLTGQDIVEAMRYFVPLKTPQQQDGESCGVFTCLFGREAMINMLYQIKEDKVFFAGSWGQNEASQFRRRMAFDLTAHHLAAREKS